MYLNSVHLQIVGLFNMWFLAKHRFQNWYLWDQLRSLAYYWTCSKQCNWDQNLISVFPAVLFVVLLPFGSRDKVTEYFNDLQWMVAKCHSLEYNYNLKKKKKGALPIYSKCIFDGCFFIFVIGFFFPSSPL